MADYYPLLARALESLPEAGPEARASVYERAKAALSSQLGSVQPPLGPDAVARELASLDEAIARVERGHAERAPVPAGAAPPEPGVAADDADPRRPLAIRRGGRRGRSPIVAIVLALIIGPLAVAAWLWRDQPQPVREAAAPRVPAPPVPASPPGTDPKFPERVGPGGAGRGTGPATAPTRPAAEPGARDQPSGTAPANPVQSPPASAGPPDVVVAQKAALVEENTANPQQPKITSGRALWRLDVINPGQGQSLETVVRANVDVPDAGVSLLLTLRRNRDATLPASHTIDLAFTTAKAGDPGWIVRDVNPPLLRQDDGQRGVPIAALSVPVKENLFLIGLSDLRGDVERNTDLLLNRGWMELPLRFGSGLRATLVFEKGVSGDRVMADAFRQWAAP